VWVYATSSTLGFVGLLTFLVLLMIVTASNPLRYLWKASVLVIRNPHVLWILAGVILVLMVNGLQLKAEELLSPHISWDFTHQVAQVGTELLIGLQRLQWAPLTQFLTFVYIILWPLLGIVALVIFCAESDVQSLRRLIVGLLTNYLVALPFYILVPVKEAWSAGVGIRFLIPEVYPLFETQYRPMSGLDNCFPSLHTSLALTFALVAWRSGHRRLAIVLSVAAGLVMLSTLYLGVHWILDMLVGVFLALAASGYLTLPVARPAPALDAAY
jgi:membrane-associated phospholipid phosphatase